MATLALLKELDKNQLKVCGKHGSPGSCAFLGMRSRDARLGDIRMVPDSQNPGTTWETNPTLVCTKPDETLAPQITKRLLEGRTTAKGNYCSGPPDFDRSGS